MSGTNWYLENINVRKSEDWSILRPTAIENEMKMLMLNESVVIVMVRVELK